MDLGYEGFIHSLCHALYKYNGCVLRVLLLAIIYQLLCHLEIYGIYDKLFWIELDLTDLNLL